MNVFARSESSPQSVLKRAREISKVKNLNFYYLNVWFINFIVLLKSSSTALAPSLLHSETWGRCHLKGGDSIGDVQPKFALKGPLLYWKVINPVYLTLILKVKN